MLWPVAPGNHHSVLHWERVRKTAQAEVERKDQGSATVGNIGRKQSHLLCVIFLQRHKFSVVAAIPHIAASHTMAVWIQPSMQMLLHPLKSMWKDIQRLRASSHTSVSEVHRAEIFFLSVPTDFSVPGTQESRKISKHGAIHPK